MKRVIKFRVWDDEKKEWILGYDYPNLGGFSMFGETMLFGEWQKTLEASFHNGFKFIKLTQFTGLTDSTKTKEFPEGKEIYEGDILTTEHYPFIDEGKQNYVGVVEMVYGCWQYVLHLVNKDKSGISDGVNSIIDDDGEGGKGFEIIGNIYENPELLESK